MRRLLPSKEYIKQILFYKIHLPLVPFGITVGAILTGIVIAVAGATYGIHATSQPVFCTGCHEMKNHFQTWQVSTHREVGCEECHVMPGFQNMLKTKLMANKMVLQHFRGGKETEAIQGHVPDVNCKKCHKTAADLVAYHGIKITHSKHWNMGVGCTFCHSRVVHGPQAATINAPQMETCFKCHDGKKAANDCNLCHVRLGGDRKTMTPEWVAAHKTEATSGKEDCTRCHTNNFCNNCHQTVSPHPLNYRETRHVQDAKQSAENCNQCHEKRYCDDCHQTRRAHSLNWLSIHQEESKKKPAQCAQCHQQSFCDGCHKIYKGHPPGWEVRHLVEAKRSTKRCWTCHTQSFCDECHQHKQSLPASHQNPVWPVVHGKSAWKQASTCATCHKQEFCHTCHQTRKPASHTPGWERSHGPNALSSRQTCDLCHDEKKSCYACHTMDMPHPRNWQAVHGEHLGEGDCARCHEQKDCTACHQRQKPPSHRNAAAWLNQHGQQSIQLASNCATCHQKQQCDACHKTPMPHPSDWTSRHAKEAAQGKGICSQCHRDQQLCSDCHSKVKLAVHPAGWLQKHGSPAMAKGANCSTCHSRKYCNDCHKTPMPHPQGWAMSGHKRVASFAKNSLCYKCHAPKYCEQCHAKE
ncbi:MAG: NapC/NirT family cytochrome c [Armatimonadetes bacterium]|nr:NapC/NirT family cytochrome c [Armatimonadota bacterium]